MANKQAVLDYLKHDRTIMGGRNLYNKFSNKSLAVQSYISRLTNTKSNVRKIAYELCRLCGIKERQMNSLLSQPLQKKLIQVAPTKKVSSPEDLKKQLLNFTAEASQDSIKDLVKFLSIKSVLPEFAKGLEGNRQRENFAKEKEIQVHGKKSEDFDKVFTIYEKECFVKEIETRKKQLIAEKLDKLDVKQKESIKLRDQFPFIRSSNCPRVFHLLVADLITAHENFVKQQPLLHKNASESDLKNLVANVKANYIEKKEIFEELEYYQTNQKILGKHPLFSYLKSEDDIKKLNTIDLTKKIVNLKNSINRNKRKSKTAENDQDKKKYEDLVSQQTNLKTFAEKELMNRN